MPGPSPIFAPISSTRLWPGIWWNSSELSVQQRNPGLAYLCRNSGTGCGAGFPFSGVGEGVLPPSRHAFRRATSNARGPPFFSFGGARSPSSRSAAGRVRAYPKEQSGNFERWSTRVCAGKLSVSNKVCVNGCKSDGEGSVGSRYWICGMVVRL
jgi:hypothetical protein